MFLCWDMRTSLGENLCMRTDSDVKNFQAVLLQKTLITLDKNCKMYLQGTRTMEFDQSSMNRGNYYSNVHVSTLLNLSYKAFWLTLGHIAYEHVNMNFAVLLARVELSCVQVLTDWLLISLRGGDIYGSDSWLAVWGSSGRSHALDWLHASQSKWHARVIEVDSDNVIPGG